MNQRRIYWLFDSNEVLYRLRLPISFDILTTMKYWIARISHPLRGLKYAFTRDFAVRFETKEIVYRVLR